MLVCLWGGILHAQNIEIQHPTSVQESKHIARPPVPANKILADTAHLEWVKHLASNSASSVDFATDVAIDASGFVYVTGKSESSEDGRDYLTIKYTSLGQEVWRAQYDGPAHADDVPIGLAVDVGGNVYVTGMSIGPSPCYSGSCERYDYATIKYDPSGQEQWVSRYSGPGNRNDIPVAIAIDPFGNIIVSGHSDRVDSTQPANTDLATIKYTPDGLQQWVARYNSPTNSQESSVGMAIDGLGSIYVTAATLVRIDSAGVFYGCCIIKYDPGGTEQWFREIARDSTTFDVASISADSAGAVYIAGRWAKKYLWYDLNSSIFVAKYNSAGQQEWLRSYDSSSGLYYRAASLAVDDEGNVLVTGVGGMYAIWAIPVKGDRILTMKYDAVGNLLWARQFRDRQGALVNVSDIVVDHAGNTYVLGSSGTWNNALPFMSDSIVTLKYDGNGIPQWVEYYKGGAGPKNEASCIVVDDAGNVVVAGASGTLAKSDFVTIKYQPSGIKQWDAQATGQGSSFESVDDLALDASGNAYVTGSSLDRNSSYDYFTAKFNPQGDQLWKAMYNGPASRADRPNEIALDRLGNVYVTGFSEGVGTSKDWATIKYNSSGIQQWVARYNGQSNQNDEGFLVAVDSALNVYVAGATASGSRLTTIKYDASGLQQWTASYDSTNFVARPGGLRVDQNGNVHVTNHWVDAIAFKYNSLGDEVWRVPGGNDILVDDSANVYVSGSNSPPNWTNKYNSSGTLIWHLSTGGTQIEFDHVGDIFFSNDNPSFSGKISRGGTVLWRHYGPSSDCTPGFSVDGFGNMYLSGFSFPGYQQGSYSQKISPTGSVLWLAGYSPENSLLATQACRVDASGNLYVAGTSQRSDFSNIATILKYAQITVSVGKDGSTLPGNYSLSQNYPNPFNPSTTIRFALPKSGHVELKVYNTLGQEVATLVNEEKTAGTYSAQWNAGSVASGVYFYRLRSGEYTETRKLLLLR